MAIRKPVTKLPLHEPLEADDFYALPETAERYELYDGMLLMVPPPDSSHQFATGRLTQALMNYADQAGGQGLASPIGVQLSGETVFEPDVIFLAPGQEALVEKRGIRGVPALVIEVTSPSTRRFDMHTKLPAYFEYGAREVWIVDPQARTVAVHSEGGRVTTTVAFGETIPSAVVSVGSAGLERLPGPSR